MKAHLILIAKIVISGLSLWALSRAVNWHELETLFRKMQLGWIVLALAIFWVAQVVSALRCAYAARTLGGDLDLWTSVRAHFIGLWFNQMLPTSLGGDVIKIAVLRDKVGLSVALRAGILDRLSGLVFLMCAIAVLLPCYASLFPRIEFTYGLALLSGASLLGLLLCAWGAQHIEPKLLHRPVLLMPVRLLMDVWMFRSGVPLWGQCWTSAVVHFNGIIAYGLLGTALGVDTNLMLFVLVVPLVFLVALMPVSFAGWGVREAGAVWLFGLVGVGREAALAMSISFGLMLVISGLPGLLMFLRQPVKTAE